MKQNYALKLSFAVVLMLASVVSGSAASYISRNGIRYVYNSKKTAVSVTSLKAPEIYTGDIVVPESIINGDNETIPVVGVGSSAFSDCDMVTSVILPASVTSIGDYAFDGCENLKTVEMPGVKTIGHWSFRNCYVLENLKFPETLTSIGNYSFDKNLKMTVVELPASLTNLGGFVFEGNPQITRVICHADTPPAIKKGYLDGDEIYTLFEDTDYGTMELFVPEESISKYQSLLGWSYFKNRIYPIGTLGVKDVTEAAPEVSVKALGNGAVEVTLPEAAKVNVYSIVGNVVKSVNLREGKSEIAGLAPGFYIICGKKVAVK
ncbi:MAG: leucine-rich repeat domain-containing protein [Muribaculaceae bacterium]|nr:leucine-rich repeat domain-containing protein [Muribaculaceae bacterium]